jgi:hypothetical protein
MVSAPVRKSAHSSAIAALPNRLLARWLSVTTPLYLERHAQLQVVLQGSADARQFVLHLDAVLLEQCGRADARELQQLRRADCTGGEDRLDPRRGKIVRAAAIAIPACAIASRYASRISQDSRCGSTRHSPPAPCISSAPPPPSAISQLYTKM